MKKIRKITAMLMTLIMVFAMTGFPAYADSSKVVTLGADLTEEDRDMILDYFGINGENVPTITVNNQEERDHLADYIPLEQIGTRTYSCSYVCPTDDGGIQVKTANLTYVTSNMIASALATSGVSNCDVLAASPFPVSGTGALTGILMAYEEASDEELDEEKKDAAMQELVTTAEIGDDTDKDLAAWLVNELKKEIMNEEGLTEEDVKQIVDDALEEYGISLSDEDRQLLYDLMEKIAGLEYDMDAMKETLDRVEQNVAESVNSNPDVNITIENSSESSGNSTTIDDDSILNNTNENALGDVTEDATFNVVVEDEATMVIEAETETETENGNFFDDLASFVDDILGGDDEEESESDTEAPSLNGLQNDITNETDESDTITVTLDDLMEEKETEAEEKPEGSCTIVRFMPETVYTEAPDQELMITIKNTINADINAVLDIDSVLADEWGQYECSIPSEESISVSVPIENIPEDDKVEVTCTLTLEDGTEDVKKAVLDIADPEEITAFQGDSVSLKDEEEKTDLEDETEETVEWISSDETIATANDGIVTAKSEGEAFIKEMHKDGTVIIYKIIVSSAEENEEDNDESWIQITDDYVNDDEFFVDYDETDEF